MNLTTIATSEAELTTALAGTNSVIHCPCGIDIAEDHDLNGKNLVVAPEVFNFVGGSFSGVGNIAREHEGADYPIFMNATIGVYAYYANNDTVSGHEEASVRLNGSSNDNERDVTMWEQWHQGSHSDAIEAAQNSLIHKPNANVPNGLLADVGGVVTLPSGNYAIQRPLYVYRQLLVKSKHEKIRNDSQTILTKAADFTVPNRLTSIDEDYMVVFAPQNREDNGRAPGDGFSMFGASLKGVRLDATTSNTTTGGINYFGSTNSGLEDIEIRNWARRGIQINGDAHHSKNIEIRQPVSGAGAGSRAISFHNENGAERSKSIIITNLVLGQGGGDTIEVGIEALDANTSSITIQNLNVENTDELFNIFGTNFEIKNVFKLGGSQRIGRIRATRNLLAGVPATQFRFTGSLRSSGSYIEVRAGGGNPDAWRVVTHSVDNTWFNAGNLNDHGAFNFGATPMPCDFDLSREFAGNRNTRTVGGVIPPNIESPEIPPVA